MNANNNVGRVPYDPRLRQSMPVNAGAPGRGMGGAGAMGGGARRAPNPHRANSMRMSAGAADLLRGSAPSNAAGANVAGRGGGGGRQGGGTGTGGARRAPNPHRANSMRMSAGAAEMGMGGPRRMGSNGSSNGSNGMNMSININSGNAANGMRRSPVHAAAPQNPSWFGTNANSGNLSDLSDNDNEDDRTMATFEQALKPSAINRAKEMTYPMGDVTIIYTDVQGSTSLWESCPTDMKKAQDIHDHIMRRCYTNHSGYEITTEGDAFNLAFQYPIDALAFALEAQLKLYKADWPPGILRHQDGKDEPNLKMRGFRVRFGIHHGPTTSRVHEMTGRMVYSGEGVKIAKCIEGMCHGGQILCSVETWKAVSGMAERVLGRPQVLDCGEHLMFESRGVNPNTGGAYTSRCTRKIMQVVPSELAFDFFEARGRNEVEVDGKTTFQVKDASKVHGRLFLPVISKRQFSTGFLNAPYVNGRVTICFVYTVGLEDNPATKGRNLAILSKYVRKQMLSLKPPGYECQEDAGCWMLAFDRMVSAVFFGLQLRNNVHEVEGLAGSVNRDAMFKVGVVSGAYTAMGPHRTTGMADYFGPIVNRTARVCSNCEPGQVCVGIPQAQGVSADSPDFGDTVEVRFLGLKKLKGISIDIAIFQCSMKIMDMPYR